MLRVKDLGSARQPDDLDRGRGSRVCCVGLGGVDRALRPRRSRGGAGGRFGGRDWLCGTPARGGLAALARGRARVGRRMSVDRSDGCCSHRRRGRSSRLTSWWS